MKTVLQTGLTQQLKLTPQLMQSISLLQMSSLELGQEINRYLENNPLLEEESSVYPSNDHNDAKTEGAQQLAQETTTEITDGPDSEDQYREGYNFTYSATCRSSDDEPVSRQEAYPSATSLRDHLVEQLALSNCCGDDRQLLRILIEALDENGYLSLSLDELFEELQSSGYEKHHEGGETANLGSLQTALLQLQSFDPAGVGARDLRECLRLQLLCAPASKQRELALNIVDNHLGLLAAHDLTKLKRLIDCDEETLNEAHALIVNLDPLPGARFAQLTPNYIVPDVIVKKQHNRWLAEINPDIIPPLRINQFYASVVHQQRHNEQAPLGAQLQEARWFIKSLHQRRDTILKVAQTIIDRQNDFFERGPIAMRPLVMRDIAVELQLHESTISRATIKKYIATPRGVFELKYFFTSPIAAEYGDAYSSTSLRELIKQLIEKESSHKPLSDQKISEILRDQGVIIARRTVAKYREAMGLPTVNQRKAFKTKRHSGR